MPSALPALCVVALLAFAGEAHATVVWPYGIQWHALQSGGSPVTDPDGPNPDTTDVIGTTSLPAGFVAYDSVNGNLFFRMRLDRYQANTSAVWQILLDTDSDTDVDWSLQLDTSGSNAVELVSATTGGPNYSNVALAANGTWSGAISTYSRFVSTSPDSSFGSASDIFLDLAIPFSAFYSATGVSTTTSFRVAITTSTTHSGINKDFPGSLGSSSAVSGGWGDSFSASNVQAVPEPGAWALFGLGGLLLAAQRRRSRLRSAARTAA